MKTKPSAPAPASVPAAAPPDPQILESLCAQAAFPKASAVSVDQVARVLGVCGQKVIDLIEEYRETGGASGLAAIDISSGLQSQNTGRGRNARRAHYRIPVSAFEAFVNARSNPDWAALAGGVPDARRRKDAQRHQRSTRR